jgi:hypothetical protein
VLQFFVNEKPGNIPVPDSSLQVDREKLMHVIGVRSDMNEFFHIHPEPEEELFVVEHVFAQPGSYKVWSEVKKDDVLHVFGHAPVSVAGEDEREAKRVSFERTVLVSNQYEVALVLEEPVGKGHNHMLSFDIHTGDGQKIEVEDYLAAPMHLSIMKDDLTHLIHAHPEETEGDINFETVFPEVGLYKLFAQFRPAGIELPEDEALLATFWIEVKEASAPGTPEDHHESTQLKPLVSPAWWLLLAVSLGLIALLSIAVHKFITIKPTER